MVAVKVSSPSRFRREATGLAGAIDRGGHSGWDPYDALASPYVRSVARTPLSRRLAIQLTKRSPINLGRWWESHGSAT